MDISSTKLPRLGTLFVIFAIALTTYTSAADKPQVFQAIARGTGQQLGASYGVGVEVTIDSYSSPEDHKTLMDAFHKNGNQGLVDALKKMPVRGKLWFSGQPEFDVTYIREVATPKGRKIRLITNRFVTITEQRGKAQQVSDYNLSALELSLSSENGKNSGVFLPACRVSLDNKNEIQVAAYGNRWRLDNIKEKTGK